MQKWEYLHVRAGTSEKGPVFSINGESQEQKPDQYVDQLLRDKGWEGWELVGLSRFEAVLVLIFKRPL